MTPDGTDSLSTSPLAGTYVTEQTTTAVCSATEVLPDASTDPSAQATDSQPSWCYIYLHNRRIDSFKAYMDARSPFRSFVLRARPRTAPGSAAQQAPRQLLIGGIVFLQGEPDALTRFFRDNDLPLMLVRDCATHRPAIIADRLMRPLRQVVEVAADRLTFLPKPYDHYADGHTRLRIVEGTLKGLEGCVMRINRDRKLVMLVGSLTVAINGIHREVFEEAGDALASRPRPKRHLTPLEEQLDRNLFFPQSQTEVKFYADNVALLHRRALQMLADDKPLSATDTLLFLLEEIIYHFSAPTRLDLTPVRAQAHSLLSTIAALTAPADTRLPDEEKLRLSHRCEALTLGQDWLLE